MAILLLSLPALAAAASSAPISFEVYPIGFSDGAAMEQMAKAMVGADGTVTLDAQNRRLLVLATPEQHKQIAALVSKTAVSPKNVRIEVTFSGGEIENERGAAADGQVGVGREDGVTHVKWKVRPQVVDRSVDISTDTRQQLLVASGREGKLSIGQSAPYQTWLVDYGVTHGFIQRQLAWRDVGSFLAVEPTVIGDGPLIRVRVTPELIGTVNGSPCETRFASVATEVTVNDGETVTLGGDEKNSEFYSRFLIGVSRSGSSRHLNITLTPHILELSRPPVSMPPHGADQPQTQTIKVWGEDRQIPSARP